MEPLAAFCFSSFVKLLEPYSSLKKSLIAAMKVETLQVCLLGRDLISALILLIVDSGLVAAGQFSGKRPHGVS